MARGRLITVGSFDGVHVGHQSVVARTVREGKRRRLKTLALTFETPPKMILNRKIPFQLLTGSLEKGWLLRRWGIDDVVFLPFNRPLSRIRPFTFFRSVLLQQYKAKGLVVGFDFRFGADRSAGARELVRWGQEFEIPVWVIGPVKHRGRIVSSTRIRNALQGGGFSTALRQLGHPYVLAGTVKRDRGVGGKLGFPTANLRIQNGLILPRGVFAARLRTVPLNRRPSNRSFDAVCNIGVRPTFHVKKRVAVEVHVVGKTLRLRGKMVLLELHKRLRGEKKFGSPVDLQAQIRLDIAAARSFFQRKTRPGSERHFSL